MLMSQQKTKFLTSVSFIEKAEHLVTMTKPYLSVGGHRCYQFPFFISADLHVLSQLNSRLPDISLHGATLFSLTLN